MLSSSSFDVRPCIDGGKVTVLSGGFSFEVADVDLDARFSRPKDF